jgi:hypothetical protein
VLAEWVGDPVDWYSCGKCVRSYGEAVEVQQRVQQWVQQSKQRNAHLLSIMSIEPSLRRRYEFSGAVDTAT